MSDSIRAFAICNKNSFNPVNPQGFRGNRLEAWKSFFLYLKVDFIDLEKAIKMHEGFYEIKSFNLSRVL